MNEQKVEFTSERAVVRGLLLTDASPPPEGGRPLVVMAHGTSATIQMVAIDYARVFAAAGLATTTIARARVAKAFFMSCSSSFWPQIRGTKSARKSGQE